MPGLGLSGLQPRNQGFICEIGQLMCAADLSITFEQAQARMLKQIGLRQTLATWHVIAGPAMARKRHDGHMNVNVKRIAVDAAVAAIAALAIGPFDRAAWLAIIADVAFACVSATVGCAIPVDIHVRPLFGVVLVPIVRLWHSFYL